MKHRHALADTVALVRAVHFGANTETLSSNVFQSAHTEPDAATCALREQAALAAALDAEGVNVVWLEPPADSRSPDGVFPNNWFSTHADGRLVLYPMEAPSRRGECLADLDVRLHDSGFAVREKIDLTPHAREGRYLEGTGSLVLDRVNRIAYACPSSRTDARLAADWAARLAFDLHLVAAADPAGRAIYHTNVILSLGAGLAMVCLQAIPGRQDRHRLRQALEASDHEILEIDWRQVRAFAGNQLFLRGRGGPVVALSAAANAALDVAQKTVIDRHARRIVTDVATIERHGGGGVRCMLAEIFLPRT